tara:strand:- start:327 stop:599 length:273 start_codon:yes stop_codon:yes gene_type:complete
MRRKVYTKTAKVIECKYTGVKLNQAIKKHHNSRAFKKLPNGEFMCLSNEAMRKHLDELYSNEVEHEGDNFIKDNDEEIRRIKKNLGLEIE